MADEQTVTEEQIVTEQSADEPMATPPEPSDLVPIAYHAIMDATGCNISKLNDANNIVAWLKELTALLGESVSSESTATNSKGLTGAKVYENGSADIQCVNEAGHVYVDLFCFAGFDPQAAEDLIQTYFAPTNINKVLLPRNADISL